MVPLKLIQVNNGCIYDDPECLPFVHEHDHYHSTGRFFEAHKQGGSCERFIRSGAW